jgi:hypothetical protein
MKALRFLIFIPIIIVIIETLFILMPLPLIWLMGLSKIWLIAMLIFFGALLMGIFLFLPGAISYITSKISPNTNFAFYITLVFSSLLAISHIIYYWNTNDFVDSGINTMYKIIFSCLTIGFSISISIGAGVELMDEKSGAFSVLGNTGSFFFYIGILLIFCLISVKVCYINPDKTYSWASGIWHGIFVLPHWIAGWFLDDIYCKAPNSTIGYSIWWWFSLIFIGPSILGFAKRRE